MCLLLGRPRIGVRRSFLLVGSLQSAVVVVGPWLVRNFWFTANSWRSRAHSDMPSGRATVRSVEGRTRWCGKSVERISGRHQGATDIKGLNRELWEARHEAGYIDDIALSRDDYQHARRRLGAGDDRASCSGVR